MSHQVTYRFLEKGLLEHLTYNTNSFTCSELQMFIILITAKMTVEIKNK